MQLRSAIAAGDTPAEGKAKGHASAPCPAEDAARGGRDARPKHEVLEDHLDPPRASTD